MDMVCSYLISFMSAGLIARLIMTSISSPSSLSSHFLTSFKNIGRFATSILTELFILPLLIDVVSPCLTSFTSAGLIATSNIVTEPSILSLLLDRLLKLCNHEKQIVRKKSLVVLDRSVTTAFFLYSYHPF
jgi:hypothetical protein